MSAGAVRAVVVAVCAAGIVGMIVSSIADSTGGAVTFGLVTAVAVLCLMVATAVSRSGPRPAPGAGPDAAERPATAAAAAPDEALAARLETRIQALVASGADEAAVRALVGDAVRFGRGT